MQVVKLAHPLCLLSLEAKPTSSKVSAGLSSAGCLLEVLCEAPQKLLGCVLCVCCKSVLHVRVSHVYVYILPVT